MPHHYVGRRKKKNQGMRISVANAFGRVTVMEVPDDCTLATLTALFEAEFSIPRDAQAILLNGKELVQPADAPPATLSSLGVGAEDLLVCMSKAAGASWRFCTF